MGSEVRISVFSTFLPAAELRRLVTREPDRSVSVGELIPPLYDNDERERISKHSYLSWRLGFVDDGSDDLAAFLETLVVKEPETAQPDDAAPTWTVAILFDSDCSGDQIIFDGQLLHELVALRAEFYVKLI